jgi:hypothetical protein
MKIRILSLVVGAGALAAWGAGCTQPQIDCRVLHGAFAAKYTLVSGGMECSDLVGNPDFWEIGMQSYTKASEDRQTPDTSTYRLAIRTLEQAVLVDEAATFGGDSAVTKAQLDGVSDFAATEPTEDICTLTGDISTEVAVTDVAAIPDDPATPDDDESYPGLAATTIKYEWKNVRVLSTPSNPGNLMEAELTYTKGACTATYQVIAVAPVIGCTAPPLDENGVPKVDDKGDPLPDEPFDKLCDDQPDPEYGIGFGSGLSPDVQAKCDKDLGICVATNTALIPGGP